MILRCCELPRSRRARVSVGCQRACACLWIQANMIVFSQHRIQVSALTSRVRCELLEASWHAFTERGLDARALGVNADDPHRNCRDDKLFPFSRNQNSVCLERVNSTSTRPKFPESLKSIELLARALCF